MNFISSITLQFRDAFSSGFTGAKNSFAGMKGALDDINKNQSMNRLAADLAMATSLTEPFRRGLSNLMDEPSKLAGTFDSSMKNIQAITGMSSAQIKVLGDELNAIGGKAAAGPLAVADAYNDVAGGITNITAQKPVLLNALALAEAGQADLGVSANALVKIMNSYGFSTSKAATEIEQIAEINQKAAFVSDVLTQSVGMGVGKMNEFASAMAPVSGLASSVGVGFDEVGSTMAYITSTIGNAAEAGTMVESFTSALLKPNKDLTDLLEKLGISSGSAMLAEYGLAESAYILTSALGGNQDALQQALGRKEAMLAATVLAKDEYVSFATQFGQSMQGVTAAAQAVQVESFESKVARLQAAQDGLKIQIGDDINAIKGFFVDMGAGFLNYVAAPIMSSPLGGVFQGIAAGVGLAAKGVLDMGSGALQTASQLVMLTATMQNMGGFMNLFKNSLSLLGTPFKMIGGLALKAIGPVISFGVSLWTALAPILPIVAAVAALAVGGYLLIKNWDAVSVFFVNLWNKITGAFSAAWDWIQNLLAGTSDWVLGALAVFLPFIGIPALIVKHWDTIKAFFAGLWVQVTELFSGAWNGILIFFNFVWNSIVTTFVETWNGLSSFFVSVWNGITGVVAAVAGWFSGVWNMAAGSFASAWLWVKDLFTSVWEGIKGVILGFVEWLQPVIDLIVAPFKAIGNVIGGIIGAVTGWFGETVETGQTELARAAENKMAAANMTPAAASDAAPAAVNNPAIAVPAVVNNSATAAPSLTATTTGVTESPALAAPTQIGAGTPSSGNSLLAEHLAAASRKGVSGTVSAAASDAFMAAGVSAAAPGIDLADYEKEARVNFAEAVRPARRESVSAPWSQSEGRAEKKERASFTVQNLYLQSDEIEKAFDLYRQLELIFAHPQEAAV